jgi:hypothetical protein
MVSCEMGGQSFKLEDFLLKRLDQRVVADLFLDQFFIHYLVNRVEILMEMVRSRLYFLLHLRNDFVGHNFAEFSLDHFSYLLLGNLTLLLTFFICLSL